MLELLDNKLRTTGSWARVLVQERELGPERALVKGAAQGWAPGRARELVPGQEREPVMGQVRVAVLVRRAVPAQARVEVLEQEAVQVRELGPVQVLGLALELAQEPGHLGSQRMHFPHSK